MAGSFDIRIPSFGLRQVRKSNFVIRHCPNPHDGPAQLRDSNLELRNGLPFNVNAVDKERLKDMVGPGRRFRFGLRRTDNANYLLWIQLFHSALKNGESATSGGREGFVMADSASDARASEQEIRQKLIESRAVDVMVAVGPNMLYTVTLEEPVGGNLLEQLKLVA